ncbi:uncharacterized protein LOC62_07G009790 [Vanrija pseudolonga]|uniref:Uncharacterized protein n=1 Tax=Vanrija pseudolonga TaxID=143232 RepID=A0AAF1BUN3_9TREE|nr:hypothetical protein LOC62_07G009790 [Vanrija pseudolonga]
MIDIERRWDALEPKRVHVITEELDDDPYEYGKFAVSDGVLVVQQSRGWSVYDLSNTRDVEPGALQPVHRVDLEFTVDHIAVSRAHNLLAALEVDRGTEPPRIWETDESGNYHSRHLCYTRVHRVHLFELFTQGRDHPQALKPVIDIKAMVHDHEIYRHRQVSGIGLGNHITIAGDNIMIACERHGPSPQLINWRTGAVVMQPSSEPKGMRTERYLAVADDTVLACGSTFADYDSTIDTHGPWNSGLAFLGLEGAELTFEGTPIMERQRWINLFGEG